RGKHRWIAKADLKPVPLDKSAIQSVLRSQDDGWEGLGADRSFGVEGQPQLRQLPRTILLDLADASGTCKPSLPAPIFPLARRMNRPNPPTRLKICQEPSVASIGRYYR